MRLDNEKLLNTVLDKRSTFKSGEGAQGGIEMGSTDQPQPFDDALREALREKIEKEGRSLSDIGKQYGVDASILSRFLRAERTLTLPSATKLAQGLGVKSGVELSTSGGRARLAEASVPRQKRTETRPVHIQASEIREVIGSNANRECHVSAGFLAQLTACLKHLSIEPESIGVSAAALKKWHFPNPDGESVRTSTLLAAMLGLDVSPERWATLGLLSETDSDRLSAYWDRLVQTYHGRKLPPNHDLKLQIGDSGSELWAEIKAEAELFLMEGRAKHDARTRPLIVEPINAAKPLWEEILDFITEGTLKKDEAIPIGSLTSRLSARLKQSVPMRNVLRSLEELERRRHVIRVKQEVFKVEELSDADWEQIIDFRKYLEPLNIKWLLTQDRSFVPDVLHNVKDWLHEMQRAFDDRQVAEFFFADIKFHCALAGSSSFRHTLMQATLPFIRRAGPRLNSSQAMKKLLEDHKAIVDALAPFEDLSFNPPELDRDRLIERAGSVMQAHLHNALELFKAG